jgi:hypothetical protein
VEKARRLDFGSDSRPWDYPLMLVGASSHDCPIRRLGQKTMMPSLFADSAGVMRHRPDAG